MLRYILQRLVFSIPVFLGVVTIVFTFVVTYVVAKVLDMSIGLRVTTMEEEVGLDISAHGERAYS